MFASSIKELPSLVITILDDHHIAVVWRRRLRSGGTTLDHIRIESSRGSGRRRCGGTCLPIPIPAGEEVAPTEAPDEGGRVLIDGPVVLTAGRTTKKPGHEIVLRSVGLADDGTRCTLRIGTSGVASPLR